MASINSHRAEAQLLKAAKAQGVEVTVRTLDGDNFRGQVIDVGSNSVWFVEPAPIAGLTPTDHVVRWPQLASVLAPVS